MTVCTPHSYAGPQACPYCRIAELEAKLETTSERAQWDLDWRIEAEALTRKLDDRIAQAVAELERMRGVAQYVNAAEVIDATLEALR